MAEAISLIALAAALAAAIVRHDRAPEALVALGGAAVLIGAGVLSWGEARDESGDLAPTLVVLAALLVLGDGCERAGLFDALAVRIAAGARGSGVRLLALVFAAAAGVTAVLGLDATVVLLTPAALAAAAKARLPSRPHVYACTHLANSASLLLPISNLTNLLAFNASGLSFTRFAALMALPWAVAIAIEWIVLRRVFAGALETRARAETPARGRAETPATDPAETPSGAAPATSRRGAPSPPIPRAPLAVLAFTLAGFVVAGLLGLDAAWPAAAGALAMAAIEGPSWRALDVRLLGFVLGLGLIVRGVAGHGLGDLVHDLLPASHALPALLGAAALAALLANLLNNVPALLVLLPAAAAAGPTTVLAILIGVNAGPNLTYTGSLATLLWRRILRHHSAEPPLGEFLRLGALTVPAILAAGTVALWLVA